MRMSILPRTRLGKWSVGLAGAFVLFFVLSGVLRGAAGVKPKLFGPIIGVTLGITGIATLVTSLLSVIRNKERAILVFLAVVVGIFVLVFLLGELLFPH